VQVRRLTDEQLKRLGESRKVFESMNKFRGEQKACSSITDFDFLHVRGLDFKWPA
jgi:hypothetical protein